MQLWWPGWTWLSSGAAMFLFFNILVGAVVVMSRGERGGHGRRLCRSASSMVRDRLRSFSSMFPVHPEADCYYYRTTTEAGELQVGVPAPEQQGALESAAMEPPSAPAATAAADAPVSMQESETDGAEERNMQCQQHRTPYEPSPPAASAATAVVERTGKEQPSKEAPESSCKRRARTCRREEEEVLEGKAELNARAELFIHQFRQDLKLQRLNSIINYTRELRRRAGVALPQD